jgi:hypothetical protein
MDMLLKYACDVRLTVENSVLRLKRLAKGQGGNGWMDNAIFEETNLEWSRRAQVHNMKVELKLSGSGIVRVGFRGASTIFQEGHDAPGMQRSRREKTTRRR